MCTSTSKLGFYIFMLHLQRFFNEKLGKEERKCPANNVQSNSTINRKLQRNLHNHTEISHAEMDLVSTIKHAYACLEV